MSAVTDGEILAQYGLKLNYLILFLFITNIIFVLINMTISAIKACHDKKLEKAKVKLKKMQEKKALKKMDY